MPLKELSMDEQIRILEDLDSQEKMYDRHLSLAKGDAYSLKYKHNIDVEPEPMQMMQEMYRQQPTIEAIKSVSDQLRRKSLPPNEGVSPPDQLKVEPFVPEPEDKESITLKKHNFPTMKEIEENNLDLADLIVKISNYNKTFLGVKLATLTRSGRKDSDEYQAIQGDVQVLKNFRSKLLETFDRQRVLIEKMGQGVKIGKYYADASALQQGLLKLRKKNKSRVKGVDDIIVGEGVKLLLLRKRFKPTDTYSLEDLRKYSKICALTEHTPNKQIRERIYVTNIVDAQRRLVNAIGEIKAGNNNSEIVNEVVTLADFLLKHGKLTKDEYKHLMAVINERSYFPSA